MNKLPIIETERLILRPIQLTDAGDMFEYSSDSEVTKYLTFLSPKNIAETIEILTNCFLNRDESDIPESYCLVLKENSKMIGVCDFSKIDIKNECAEIGFVINRKFWGHGYTLEALKKVIEVGFLYFNFRRIVVSHMIENEQSQRVIEKADFRYEGCLRQSIKDGKGIYHDLKVYSILKDEFDNKKLKWQKEKVNERVKYKI